MERQPKERLRGAWPPLRRRSSWAAALLAAAYIVSSCFLLTEGQPGITYLRIQVLLQPPYPVEGQNATLTPNLGGRDPEEMYLCDWHRGMTIEGKKRILAFYTFPPNTEQVNESASTGRETAGPGCSLHIRNLTSEDTGYYTVVVYGAGIYLRGQTSVVVSELLSSPVLWPSDVLVAENSHVTLKCTTSNNPGVSVSWFKDGKHLLVVTGLSDWNRTLNLFRVTKNDAGLYTCETSNPVISAKSNSAKITMAYGPEIKLNPEGTVEKSLNSDLKLECTAVSVPAAQFQWYFNNTTLNATGNIFQVRLSNWTEEGNYTCQATNPFTLRRAMKTAYVKLTKDPPALGAGTIAGIIIGSLAVTALIVGSLLYVFLRSCGQRDKKSTQTIAAPSTYENVSSSTQVMIDSSADSSHNKYQTLQHPDQSVYQQLEGSRKVSQPVSLS